MPAPATPVATPLFAPDPLLHDLLAVSLTAINLLRPCYSPTGELDDFTPEYFNPAAQRMTGLPERPVGTARTLFPDIFTNGIFAFYRQVFETGAPDQFQLYYQADGLDNYFRIAARRSGERLWVNFTDTADQSRTPAENALRESQAAEKAARAEAEVQRARFYEVLMALPALVATYHGPTHVYNFANGAYQRYFPTPVLLGRSLRDVLPETEAQGVLAVMDRVYQTGESSYQQELEVWLDHTGSGQPQQLFLNLLFHPLRDAQGRIDGLLDFSYDVTEQVLARRQVEQLNQEAQAARAEAEAERQRLYQVLMRMPANIALLRGPEHVYDLVNAEYERLFPARTTLGRTIREVIPDIEGQGFYELFDRVYETGEPFYEAETEAWADYAGTGELQRRYYRTAFEPIRNAEGQITEVLNFAVDVTQQVEARQQVEQLNAKLEDRVRARTEELAAINEELQATNNELGHSNRQLTRTNVDLDTFVYTASHDLKAPITNIESIVLALRDTLPPSVQQDDVVAHLLSLLDTTVARFQFTIAQLTDISRLQLAHAGPAEPVRLAAALESVRLDLAPALRAADTQLVVEVTPDLVVSFSPSNLRSIVYNLLSNAVKYRAPDRPSQVRVHAQQTAQATVLTVQDNGLGMSEVQQRQLFGLFQRLHTHVEGAGVDLYITKRLVENGGGSIAVHSQPNVGTTFTITFPA